MLHDFISNNGTDRRGTVIIGRQVNFRLVDDDDKFIDNDREEYIEEDDPRKKRDDFYSSVYVLNENTQVSKASKQYKTFLYTCKRRRGFL